VCASSKRSRHQSQSQHRQRQDVGQWAEAVVARWLAAAGYEILHQRWHCRWGELDLVAQQLSSPATLAFVEVKARSDRNWDAGGLLAITPQKREKLWQTAELFLSQHPPLATLPCRFDVALVHYQVVPRDKNAREQNIREQNIRDQAAIAPLDSPIQMGSPMAIGQYLFTLQDYLFNVFD
jgi:putative endonuclease